MAVHVNEDALFSVGSWPDVCPARPRESSQKKTSAQRPNGLKLRLRSAKCEIPRERERRLLKREKKKKKKKKRSCSSHRTITMLYLVLYYFTHAPTSQAYRDAKGCKTLVVMVTSG